MELAIITLTKEGLKTARRIALMYKDAHIYLPVALWQEVHLGEGEGTASVFPLSLPLRSFCGFLWKNYRRLVFITATGIAVRCLAPYLKDKKKDPAVVVLDERGKYAISLLSGHLGGANRLAREIADFLGGNAVITTASDNLGLAALDVVAEEMGFRVIPSSRFAQVMGALVNGLKVGVWAEEPWRNYLATKLKGIPVEPWSNYRGPEGWEAGILVTSSRCTLPDGPWIFWRPSEIVAGIGCCRGVDCRSILRAVGLALRVSGRSRTSLKALATWDLKANEEGLMMAARRLGVPLVSFSAEELVAVGRDNPGLSTSWLAKEKFGLPGVCEPAALLGARRGELICPKIVHNRVTVALARVTSLL